MKKEIYPPVSLNNEHMLQEVNIFYAIFLLLGIWADYKIELLQTKIG